jgi:hypothetical protein
VARNSPFCGLLMLSVGAANAAGGDAQASTHVEAATAKSSLPRPRPSLISV